MADDDRQPPQAYDTVAPAGVGAATSNLMSPRAFQDLFFTGDQGLIDVAMEEMGPDPLLEFVQSIPPADVIAGWPDVTGATPVQTSTPAGVGSRASRSPSFHSPQITPESSGARTPATPPSVPLAAAVGARTAAGVGGNGGGGRGGRGGGRVGRGGGRGGGGGGGGGVLDVAVLVVVVLVPVVVVVVVVVAAAVVAVVVVVVEVVVDDDRDAYEDDDEIPPLHL